MVEQHTIAVRTDGRGMLDITRRVGDCVISAGIARGLCNVFLQHTSASLLLCENADPEVRADLERFMATLVPDGDGMFRHTAEGPDDMPAHVRSVLTANSLTLPVSNGGLVLGTWQGVYLWEHRYEAHTRRITVTIQGD